MESGSAEEATEQRTVEDVAGQGMVCDVGPQFIESAAWDRPWECFFCGKIVEGIERTATGWAPRFDRGRFGFIEARPDFVATKNDDGSFTRAPTWTWVYHVECMKNHNPPGLAEYFKREKNQQWG